MGICPGCEGTIGDGLCADCVAELREENERLDWRLAYCEDGVIAESNEARQELERLRRQSSGLLEYLNAELAHWDGRSADRWWQTKRILGRAQTLREGLNTWEAEANTVTSTENQTQKP